MSKPPRYADSKLENETVSAFIIRHLSAIFDKTTEHSFWFAHKHETMNAFRIELVDVAFSEGRTPRDKGYDAGDSYMRVLLQAEPRLKPEYKDTSLEITSEEQFWQYYEKQFKVLLTWKLATETAVQEIDLTQGDKLLYAREFHEPAQAGVLETSFIDEVADDDDYETAIKLERLLWYISANLDKIKLQNEIML